MTIKLKTDYERKELPSFNLKVSSVARCLINYKTLNHLKGSRSHLQISGNNGRMKNIQL